MSRAVRFSGSGGTGETSFPIVALFPAFCETSEVSKTSGVLTFAGGVATSPAPAPSRSTPCLAKSRTGFHPIAPACTLAKHTRRVRSTP